MSKPRIVIVGGNFAGLAAAARLPRRFDVTVVDPRADFEWTPNIHELISGVKSRDQVVMPRADAVERFGHRFLPGAAVRIDCDARSVCTDDGTVLPFDACLVAAGAVGDNYGVEGAETHCVGFRLVAEAEQIAARLQRLARRKRAASVAIIGGGISCIEALGEILRRYRGRAQLTIHVVEIADRILTTLPAAAARDVTARATPHRVVFHVDAAVAGIDKRSVRLASGESLAADLCIWAAGMKLPGWLRDTGLCDAGDEWLPVADTLQSRAEPSVFVAGDSAQLPTPLRKQAYHANDMGELAGDNLARFLDGRSLCRFRPARLPMIMSFGDLATYFVNGRLVAASPFLAAAKEGIYQLRMAQLSQPTSALSFTTGVAGRAAAGVHKLLLPQLSPTRAYAALRGTKLVIDPMK